MVYVVNGVLASGVDMVLEKDFAGFALQEMKIHPLILPYPNSSKSSKQYSIDHQPQEDLNQQRMNDVYNKWDDMIESRNKLLQSLGEMLRQQEQDCSDYEDSRARGFVHRPLDLQSLA
ncbi:hypothetical protein Tco_0408699 [Tanacetum coccineum]